MGPTRLDWTRKKKLAGAHYPTFFISCLLFVPLTMFVGGVYDLCPNHLASRLLWYRNVDSSTTGGYGESAVNGFERLRSCSQWAGGLLELRLMVLSLSLHQIRHFFASVLITIRLRFVKECSATLIRCANRSSLIVSHVRTSCFRQHI
jgi:hypothetical protein